jgi:hypothetical protein
MSASTSERVQKHREGLRAAGMRPVQIWVPDTRRIDFAQECERQSRLIVNDPSESEIQFWLDAVADRQGWE